MIFCLNLWLETSYHGGKCFPSGGIQVQPFKNQAIMHVINEIILHFFPPQFSFDSVVREEIIDLFVLY